MSSLPGVTQTIRDGALQSQPNKAALVPCLIGVASSGPFTPVRIAGGQLVELSSTFGRGPLPQLASRFVAAGLDVVLVRAAVTTAGSSGTVTTTAGGTSVITATGTPNDTYDVAIQFSVGATVGVAGAVFRYTIDNGRSWSAPVALGTANSYAVPGTGMSFAFAAGTILATTGAKVRTLEPKWGTDDLHDAVEALRSSGEEFDWLDVIGSMSSTEAATLKSELETFEAAGVYRRSMAETDAPGAAETLADWRASILTDYAAFESRRVAVGAGECLFYSALDRKTFRRPATWPIALRAGIVDPARYNIHRTKEDGFGGPLDASIFDSSGNPISHNESTNPGLDTTGVQGTARFMTLRTLATKGRRTYCTRANLMSPPGSDFQLFRHGIVMDLACTTTLRVLTEEIGETPQVEKTGPRVGKIVEGYAKAIEEACKTALREALLTPGRASDAYVIVERNDAILSTKKVRCKTYVLPLGDADWIENELSYVASALAADGE